MTREDIEKAAQSRCDRRFSYLHNNAFFDGFISGAEWRINSVWHDVIEKPNFSNIPILIQHKNGRIHFIDAVPSSWIYIQKYYIRWAYIEDLIPNMEE